MGSVVFEAVLTEEAKVSDLKLVSEASVAHPTSDGRRTAVGIRAHLSEQHSGAGDTEYYSEFPTADLGKWGCGFLGICQTACLEGQPVAAATFTAADRRKTLVRYMAFLLTDFGTCIA
jgi:hypothetical protein